MDAWTDKRFWNRGVKNDFKNKTKKKTKTCLARAASIWCASCGSSCPSVGSDDLFFPFYLKTVSKTLWIICRSSVSSFVLSTVSSLVPEICRARHETNVSKSRQKISKFWQIMFSADWMKRRVSRRRGNKLLFRGATHNTRLHWSMSDSILSAAGWRARSYTSG